MKKIVTMLAAFGAFTFIAAAVQADQTNPTWWKGNTHAHSWWSDGDAPPELIADWYKDQGYHFLVISDHNVMKQGEKWYPIDQPKRRPEQVKSAYDKYVKRFGSAWIEQRGEVGNREVKLKAIDDYRTLFEEANRFIFIKGEEITSRFEKQPIHLNGINLVAPIEPVVGASVTDTIQQNLDLVKAQELAYQQPMFTHVNHPNFHYAIPPEAFFDLDHEPGDGFFEMYNGHSGVDNYGDDLHPSMERLWDIVLSKRLGERGRGPIYGVATDDSHEYSEWGLGHTNPGRGWIMVRSEYLSPNMITSAIKRGDFYNSTGVTLTELSMDEKGLRLSIEPKPDTEYVIEFVGTLANADLQGVGERIEHPHRDNTEHNHKVVYRYSDDIGKVLKRVKGTSAQYKPTGKELYVRARVISTKDQPNPYATGDKEMAWTQPLVIKAQR
jgi:histidinol phosphatase-like PHP family hydrolase